MAPADPQRSSPSIDNPLRARLLSVCFPSGWDPAEKCDQTLFSIHQPVADNGAIQNAATAMSIAMAHKGPFVRYVYTIAPSASLWRDPGQPPWKDFQSLADLWFRVERQVTIPISGVASLFLIRLFVVPLQEVLSTQKRCADLAEALETMSPALRAYKGLGLIAPKLIGALKAYKENVR